MYNVASKIEALIESQILKCVGTLRREKNVYNLMSISAEP